MEKQITINLQKLCDNIVIVTSDVNNADEVKEKIETTLLSVIKSAVSDESKDLNQETQE